MNKTRILKLEFPLYTHGFPQARGFVEPIHVYEAKSLTASLSQSFLPICSILWVYLLAKKANGTQHEGHYEPLKEHEQRKNRSFNGRYTPTIKRDPLT